MSDSEYSNDSPICIACELNNIRKAIKSQIYGDYTPTKTLAENGSILDRLKLVRKRIESARRSGDASMLYVPIDVLDEVIREMSKDV